MKMSLQGLYPNENNSKVSNFIIRDDPFVSLFYQNKRTSGANQFGACI